jgi:hypothetical protein
MPVNYNSLIPYRFKSLVAIVMEQKGFSFIEALKYVLTSAVYQNLSNEETKLWHRSQNMLYQLLEEEKNTGVFEYPYYV